MIRIEHLCIDLPGFSVRDVNLHVERGGFYALMGPTGSGKTLVMESVAGLAPPGTGRILINDRDVTSLPPEERNISLVYQDHSLFPHLTVLQNVTFGQPYHGISRTEGKRHARELLARLEMLDKSERKPTHLSGGEKQRVSIARALACKPDVVLLDEPLSSLDPQFRDDLRKTLKQLHQELGITFLMVTHDFVDALTLADRAAVIRNGALEQSDTVATIFRHPATAEVARFVGMSNIFPAVFKGNNCVCFEQSIPMNQAPGWEKGYAALRPEDVCILKDNEARDGWHPLEGRIRRVTRQGFTWLAEIECGGHIVTAMVDQRHALDLKFDNNRGIRFAFALNHLHALPLGKSG